MCTGSKPSAPKAPKPQPIPAEAAQMPPMTARYANQAAADERRRRQASGGVGTGTILTGSRGTKPMTNLLGGGSATDINVTAPEKTHKSFRTPAPAKKKKGLLGKVLARSIATPGSQNNVGDVTPNTLLTQRYN